jgi:hypothetical protein
MTENLMIMFEFIIILLLILECWILYMFAKEHTLLLDLINSNLSSIKKYMKDK